MEPTGIGMLSDDACYRQPAYDHNGHESQGEAPEPSMNEPERLLFLVLDFEDQKADDQTRNDHHDPEETDNRVEYPKVRA